jgi:hypothetical protein
VKRALLAALLLTSSGCEGPAVFTDLARGLVHDPEEGYEPEGRRLHDGSFHDLDLEIAPNHDFVLGIDDQGDLLIQAITSGASCWIDGVSSYQSAIWRSTDFDDARLPFVQQDEQGETLHFASFDCQIADISVPRGRVVDFLPLPDERGALVEDADQNVFAVSPWQEQAVLLGHRVLGADDPFRYSLLVLDGQLVLYDALAEPIVSVGEHVVSAALLPDAAELFVAEANGGVAAIPLAEDADTVWLSDDGCDLFDSGAAGSVAAFYSPCGPRRLVLYRPAQGKTEATSVALAGDANAPRIVTRSLALEAGVQSEAMSAVFFRGLADDHGALWAQGSDEPPYQMLDDALDSWMLPAFDPRRKTQPVVAFALVPGKSEGSADLVAADADQRITIARRVLSLYESTHSLVLVAQGDDESGDLIVLQSNPLTDVELRDPELLLSNALAGLPLERKVVLPDVVGMSHLRRAEGSELLSLVRTGPGSDDSLFLVRQSQLDGSFAKPVRLTTSAGALYAFSQNVPGTVLGLVRSGRDSFRLEQLWYEQDARSTIGHDVTTFYESVASGGHGLVYATAGDSPGLYYSPLR